MSKYLEVDDYITIKVPISLRKKFEKMKLYGYTGFPDFARDAIREKLQEKEK